MGLIPGSGRFPGGGNSNSLQYSCLENSMDRRARWAKVHGFTRELNTTECAHTHTMLVFYMNFALQALYIAVFRKLNLNWHLFHILEWLNVEFRQTFTFKTCYFEQITYLP